MTYVGGLRERLIKENLVAFIESGLDELGWFGADRNHMPVSVTGNHVDVEQEIEPNIVSVSFEDEFFEEMEMGSDLESNLHAVVVDVFAESLSIGQHLKGDVLDLMRGKFTAISSDPTLRVYDINQASPTYLFSCYYENFEVERNRFFEKTHNEFWWSIAVDLIDIYQNDAD